MKLMFSLLCVIFSLTLLGKSKKIEDFSYERIPASILPSTTEQIDKDVLEKKVQKSKIKDRRPSEQLPDDSQNWQSGDLPSPYYDQD